MTELQRLEQLATRLPSQAWPSPWSHPRCSTLGGGTCPAPAALPCAAWLRATPAGPAGEADAAGGVAQKGLCRVGREVTRPGPSPDPYERISRLRLFRRCGSWLHRLHSLHQSR